MLLRFALALLCCLPLIGLAADGALLASIAARAEARGDWVAQATQCPLGLIKPGPVRDYLSHNSCEGDFGACYSKCAGGDGASCYWLAYGLQQGKTAGKGVDILFQRACRLGVMSGCTNRAAAQLQAQPQDPKVQRCAAQTFAQVCKYDEPWACTLYAAHLSRGLGVRKDARQALKVLAGSCKYGTGDPACVQGLKLREELEAELKQDSSTGRR